MLYQWLTSQQVDTLFFFGIQSKSWGTLNLDIWNWWDLSCACHLPIPAGCRHDWRRIGPKPEGVGIPGSQAGSEVNAMSGI